MARVQVTNVTVLDNPTHFLNPFQFEVTFECFEDLPEGRDGHEGIKYKSRISFVF